jgi:hypothetical protein
MIEYRGRLIADGMEMAHGVGLNCWISFMAEQEELNPCSQKNAGSPKKVAKKLKVMLCFGRNETSD